MKMIKKEANRLKGLSLIYLLLKIYMKINFIINNTAST